MSNVFLGSSPSEFQPPQDPTTSQQWDVLQTFERPPSMELDTVRPLHTNPATIYDRFSVESEKNLDRIRDALPKFAQISVGGGRKYGENLIAYGDRNEVYIGRLSPKDEAIIEGATQCAYRNTRRPISIDRNDVQFLAAGTLALASVGSIVGYLVQNSKTIFDQILNGTFFAGFDTQREGEIIGGLIGTAPGAVIAGVVGVRAIAQSVNRARANTNMLVADLGDIAGRAEQQFVRIDDRPYTLHMGTGNTLEIRAGTYVQDLLKDLSPKAVDYIWNNGLFTLLRDVETKQKELEGVDEKMSAFKSDDLTARAIAKGIRQKHGNELDQALHALVTFRVDVLPEVVRMSLEDDSTQDLR